MARYGDHNLGWTVAGKIKDGALEDFKQVMSEIVDDARQEQGTLIYEYIISEDGKRLLTLERFVDMEAARKHTDTWKKYEERWVACVDIEEVIVYKQLDDDVRESLKYPMTTFFKSFGGFAKAE